MIPWKRLVRHIVETAYSEVTDDTVDWDEDADDEEVEPVPNRPADADLPPLDRLALVVWFTRSTNMIEYVPDPRLSPFDVSGILSHALELSVEALPLHDHESLED